MEIYKEKKKEDFRIVIFPTRKKSYRIKPCKELCINIILKGKWIFKIREIDFMGIGWKWQWNIWEYGSRELFKKVF